MKKYLSLIMALIMIVSLTACGNDADTESDYESPASIVLYKESGDTAEPIEVDVSHMSNPFAYDTLVIDLPKGFTSDEQTISDAGMVLAYKGSGTTSTDCYTFNHSDEQSINDVNEDELSKVMKEELEGFKGFDKFSKVQCCGYDALEINFERLFMGNLLFQRRYYIFTGSKTYVINFTTEKEKNLKDYEESLKTIMIV